MRDSRCRVRARFLLSNVPWKAGRLWHAVRSNNALFAAWPSGLKRIQHNARRKRWAPTP